MTISIVRRGVLAISMGLAAFLAAPMCAMAQKAAGLQCCGRDAQDWPQPRTPRCRDLPHAYILKSADPARRPVTFVFNGGPAAASIYLHISAIGPKTIVTAGDGSFPAVPARLEDNPDSWISFTDLVFIDPVGTGYSRMLPGPDGKPGDPKPYYTADGDVTPSPASSGSG
jgi:carboxypeptidase C (cathepsin A)